jgi:hypothetical protein
MLAVGSQLPHCLRQLCTDCWQPACRLCLHLYWAAASSLPPLCRRHPLPYQCPSKKGGVDSEVISLSTPSFSPLQANERCPISHHGRHPPLPLAAAVWPHQRPSKKGGVDSEITSLSTPSFSPLQANEQRPVSHHRHRPPLPLAAVCAASAPARKGVWTARSPRCLHPLSPPRLACAPPFPCSPRDGRGCSSLHGVIALRAPAQTGNVGRSAKGMPHPFSSPTAPVYARTGALFSPQQGVKHGHATTPTHASGVGGWGCPPFPAPSSFPVCRIPCM